MGMCLGQARKFYQQQSPVVSRQSSVVSQEESRCSIRSSAGLVSQNARISCEPAANEAASIVDVLTTDD
jgi:hypothetical protein